MRSSQDAKNCWKFVKDNYNLLAKEQEVIFLNLEVAKDKRSKII